MAGGRCVAANPATLMFELRALLQQGAQGCIGGLNVASAHRIDQRVHRVARDVEREEIDEVYAERPRKAYEGPKRG